jgi:hypothetical protein
MHLEHGYKAGVTVPDGNISNIDVAAGLYKNSFDQLGHA